MATWQKSNPALVERFLAGLPLTQGVERRQMFGYPCAFINGNMFAGLHEQRLIVRLPEQASAQPFEVMGKVMKEYAAIEDALDCPPAQFRDWIARALAYAGGLPPKKPKVKKATVKVKAKATPKAPAGR
jgi:TfoX/Sxy family transcriptional regulator of competence genes